MLQLRHAEDDDDGRRCPLALWNNHANDKIKNAHFDEYLIREMPGKEDKCAKQGVDCIMIAFPFW